MFLGEDGGEADHACFLLGFTGRCLGLVGGEAIHFTWLGAARLVRSPPFCLFTCSRLFLTWVMTLTLTWRDVCFSKADCKQ